jgi:hypothetical protein
MDGPFSDKDARRVSVQVDALLQELIGVRCGFVLVYARQGAFEVGYSTNLDQATGAAVCAEMAERLGRGEGEPIECGAQRGEDS